jgi:deazaflavin-dependent oxidoreductase (nitroreductase family)
MDDTPRSLTPIERIASSKAGAWFFVNVTSKIDPWLLKQTDGRFSMILGSPVLLLQHVGAKSGADRETPLVYATDGDDIILIASAGGAPNHPAWYHNLVANPACHVIAKDRTGDYVAEELTGDDYDAMWAKALDVYGGYGVYQERAGDRHIPLLRLCAVDD